MQEEAERLWARARECRVVADNSQDEAASKLLVQIAEELEAEAQKIEEETQEPR
jgi:hypothetical protein